MNQALIDRVQRLRDDIRKILGNRLVYPKTLLSLDRKLSETEKEKCAECIDDSIKLVDGKLSEFLADIETTKS